MSVFERKLQFEGSFMIISSCLNRYLGQWLSIILISEPDQKPGFGEVSDRVGVDTKKRKTQIN